MSSTSNHAQVLEDAKNTKLTLGVINATGEVLQSESKSIDLRVPAKNITINVEDNSTTLETIVQESGTVVAQEEAAATIQGTGEEKVSIGVPLGYTQNYKNLSYKPSINGTIVAEALTSTELGIIDDITPGSQSTYSSQKIDSLVTASLQGTEESPIILSSFEEGKYVISGYVKATETSEVLEVPRKTYIFTSEDDEYVLWDANAYAASQYYIVFSLDDTTQPIEKNLELVSKDYLHNEELQKYVTLIKHNQDYEALNIKIDNKDSLPVQSGNSGKFLTTNGTAASWVDVYTETEIDNKITALNTAIGDKASSSALSVVEAKVDTNTASIGTLNTTVAGKADAVNVYTKTETDELLSAKATTKALSDAQSALEGAIAITNANLANKADSSTVYTTSQIDTKINTINAEIGKKATKATSLSGYGIADAYTKTEVDAKVTSVYKYRGSVETENDLPKSGMIVGDVYDISSTGMNVAWNGSAWDKLGISVDLTSYLTVAAASATYATTAAMTEALATRASAADVYNKTEINGKVETLTTSINGKATKATSLSGYGITNAYTKTETDNLLNTKLNENSVIDGGEF